MYICELLTIKSQIRLLPIMSDYSKAIQQK